MLTILHNRYNTVILSFITHGILHRMLLFCACQYDIVLLLITRIFVYAWIWVFILQYYNIGSQTGRFKILYEWIEHSFYLDLIQCRCACVDDFVCGMCV